MTDHIMTKCSTLHEVSVLFLQFDSLTREKNTTHLSSFLQMSMHALFCNHDLSRRVWTEGQKKKIVEFGIGCRRQQGRRKQSPAVTFCQCLVVGLFGDELDHDRSKSQVALESAETC